MLSKKYLRNLLLASLLLMNLLLQGSPNQVTLYRVNRVRTKILIKVCNLFLNRKIIIAKT